MCVSPLVLEHDVYPGHFYGHRAVSATGPLPCPPSPPAPRAWPTCGWRRAFASSVSPHPTLAAASEVLSPNRPPCASGSESRARELSSYSQARGLSEGERETGRCIPKGRVEGRNGLRQVCFAHSRMVRGRGRAGDVGRPGAGGPLSRAPRPPPPPPWTVSGPSPGS